MIKSTLTVLPPLHNNVDLRRQRHNLMPEQSICTDLIQYSNNQAYSGNFDSVAYRGKRPPRHSSQRTTTITLTFQNLWLRKRLEVVRERVSGLLTFTIRTYNILPYGAPVFEIVQRDDIAGMQALLQTKKASIFDRDQSGKTLLHVSSTALMLGLVANPVLRPPAGKAVSRWCGSLSTEDVIPMKPISGTLKALGRY